MRKGVKRIIISNLTKVYGCVYSNNHVLIVYRKVLLVGDSTP